MCAIASRIKKHRSIVRKKRKRDKIVSLGTYKLNSLKDIISNGLIDSNVNFKFVLINNVPKGYDNIKKEIKKLST